MLCRFIKSYKKLNLLKKILPFTTSETRMSAEQTTKRCNHCGEVKALDMFFKDKSKKDGLCGRCKVCCKKMKEDNTKKNEDNQRDLNKTKKCSKCKNVKKYSEYNKDKSTPCGIRPDCRDCVLNYKSIYRNNNKDKLHQKSKDYEASPQRALARKLYRQTTTYKLRQKELRLKNIEVYRERKRIYERNNRDKKRVYIQLYLKNNEQARLAHCVRARFHDALKRGSISKTSSTFKMIGCCIEDLKKYIEGKFLQGMSWKNYGEWHIDHIIPVASFDLTSDTEQKKCFHYSNLQPLWKIDNLKKGAKII
jgi:hypothetical protein